jgi:hypothetical protein
MNHDGAYPPSGDNWSSVLERYRCVSECAGRRCQLYAGHAEAHAHAWLERHPSDRYARRGRKLYPWRPHLIRWNDDGDQWVQAMGVEQLRWCCLFDT